MATISSTGIGSGLDVSSIVTQLVAVEKRPLKTLEAKATVVDAKISAMAKISSQFSALGDAASAMSTASAWSARTASSSNTTAATISVDSTAAATSFSLDVDALAKQQSVSSVAITKGAAVGAGVLKLQLGSWSDLTLPLPTFTPSSANKFEITVGASDTVADVATAINKANAGVIATAFFDGTQDRLLLKSKNTGETAGFKLMASSDTEANGGVEFTDNTGLGRLAFNPGAGAFGAASPGSVIEAGSNAKARINGLAITSSTNTLTGNIPGVTITLAATTTKNYNNVGGPEERSPVTMSVKEDVTVAVKIVDNFVKAYNELVTNLTDLTKYDSATKTAGAFQGDAAVNGLLSVLRNMAGSASKSGSTYKNLSDVGIVGVKNQLKGLLEVNTSKFSIAANNGVELRRLFVPDDPAPGASRDTVNGFANMFNNLAKGMLASGGFADKKASGGQVTNKVKALKDEASRITAEQTKVNDRATALETRLRKQYSALDGKMAGLNALNAYVAQQVTTWNKSTG